MSCAEEEIRNIVIADDNELLVTDAYPHVLLLPDQPTHIRETCKHHTCSYVLVFAVLHCQRHGCCPASRCSISSPPSLHPTYSIMVVLVCCRVFSCVVEKFAAMVDDISCDHQLGTSIDDSASIGHVIDV